MKFIEKHFIGWYSYTVILTYLSAVSSVVGMMFVFSNENRNAIICLLLSGALDMFDGKVARTKKNRTDDEKTFGIQIDSLCDIVCFCMFPAMINYSVSGGTNKVFAMVASSTIVVAGIIRLGYFNVMEQNRQKTTSENRKEYQGLPVTSVAVTLPVIYMLKDEFVDIAGRDVFSYVFSSIVLLSAFLFIFNFKVRKPNNRTAIFLVLFGILIVLGLIFIP